MKKKQNIKKLKEFLEDDYTPNRRDLYDHRREKHIISALRAKDIDTLLKIDEEE